MIALGKWDELCMHARPALLSTDPANDLGHSVNMVEQAVGAFERDLP